MIAFFGVPFAYSSKAYLMIGAVFSSIISAPPIDLYPVGMPPPMNFPFFALSCRPRLIFCERSTD
jgi:hypothetical protein